jgi:hypothetical protein
MPAKTTSKKTATKKTATKKTATKKTATKKTATKKPATKKPATKEPATKKAATKKAATKSAAPKADKPTAGSNGTEGNPWVLTTPAGGSEFLAWRDESAEPAALVVKVGTTVLRYDLRCLDDLHAMLRRHGDWMLLGAADEQKPAAEGTIEAWGRSPKNPLGGWYGLRKGYRGRFGMYVPMVLAALGRIEVEQQPRNNRARAI